MRQVEISRTIVFDAPRQARSFFEALIADNLDLGRPENVEIIFGRRLRCDTTGAFRTAIDRPVIDPDDKAWCQRVLQALPGQAVPERRRGDADRDRRQLPRDLGCNARQPNLDELQAKARAINARMLDTEAPARARCL